MHRIVLFICIFLKCETFCCCWCNNLNEVQLPLQKESELIANENGQYRKIETFHETSEIVTKYHEPVSAHFDCTLFDNERFDNFKRKLLSFFETKDSIRIVNLFEEYSRILGSRFRELEEILVERLENFDYEMAAVLIEMGIRIVNNLQDHLKAIIINSTGANAIVKKVFDTHIVSIGLFVSYETLLEAAVESNDTANLEIIFSAGNEIINTFDNEILCKIIEKALDSSNFQIFQTLVYKFNSLRRQVLLRSALKISIRKDRFFVIQLCAEESVIFLTLRIEERYEILKIAAEFGCLITTRHILKHLKFSEYIRSRLNDQDSPLNIAKFFGFADISTEYEKIDS